VYEVRFGCRKIGKPQKAGLAKIKRDRDRPVKSKKKRHLNEKRETAAQGIAFFHQAQLLYLQFFQPGIVLLHPLDLFL